MTQEEFKERMNANVTDFFSFWEEGRKIYRSEFPDEMNYVDWFEQFAMYVENKGK